MGPVEDDAGRVYRVLKTADTASLVEELRTGDVTYKANEHLSGLVRPGAELDALARDAPVPNDDSAPASVGARGRGLVVALRGWGPTPARALVDRVSLCESDLVGLLSELRAAGLVKTAVVGGEEAYAVSGAAVAWLDRD